MFKGGLQKNHRTRAKIRRSQHAQESLDHQRLLTLVNNLTDAVLSVDTKGIIRMYNAACLNLLDTNDTLDGHHLDKVLLLRSSEDKPVHLFQELEKIKVVTVRDDLSYILDGVEKTRLEITYSPIRGSYNPSANENQNGYIVILRDITKQKSLEEERDEFISVVSHELRTPITIVEGTLSNTQFMMERGSVDQKTLEDAVNTAHDQILYLAKMVNDLSTLSRAERGVADTPEEIDVKELVHTLYKQYEKEASDKGLHLNLTTSAHLGSIMVSRLYVEELLQNFITNALKYTVEGEVVLAVRTNDNTVTFSVKDTGIGMSKVDQKHVFEKFYRAEDYRTRETNGTGLGLYVAAKLAHKIGTTIELTSRLNHGSTFSFTLPLTAKK